MLIRIYFVNADFLTTFNLNDEEIAFQIIHRQPSGEFDSLSVMHDIPNETTVFLQESVSERLK